MHQGNEKARLQVSRHRLCHQFSDQRTTQTAKAPAGVNRRTTSEHTRLHMHIAYLTVSVFAGVVILRKATKIVRQSAIVKDRQRPPTTANDRQRPPKTAKDHQRSPNQTQQSRRLRHRPTDWPYQSCRSRKTALLVNCKVPPTSKNRP